MLRNIQQRLCCCVSDLDTDEVEVDEFEEDELGNYSIEVLIKAVCATYGSNLLRYTGTSIYIQN
eukprot:7929740-Ditylum_brightwellii.AAC.1